MIPMLLRYIDANITLSSEAVLMKKSPNHRVNGNGTAENIAVHVAAELMKNHLES